MAERIVIPTEADKCNWADGGTYPSADPGAPARLAGFKPKDYPVAGAGAIVPAEDHNFLWRLGMEMLSWMRDFVIRQWADVSEGIAASSARDVFQVMPSDDISAIGAQVFKVTGTGTGSTYVGDPCTDGEQVYYHNGNGYIIAADPTDGSEVWESTGPWLTTPVSVICTDGAYVYVLGPAGDPGLYRFLRTTGAQDSSAGTYTGGTKMLCNGEYAAVIESSAGAGTVAVYSNIQGTIAQDGNYATGSIGLKAVGIDRDNAYVGGIRSAATHDVWAVNLITLAYRWRITLPTTAAPQVEGIVADGNRVYVTTDRQALTAGGYANLYCLDRVTGAVLWSMDVTSSAGTAYDLEEVATDGRRIYASDPNDDLHVIDIRGAVPSHVGGPVGSFGTVANITNPVCDGVSVIGNSNLTSELTRIWTMDSVATFRRVDGDDLNRKPFYTLAVPTDRG